MAEETLTDEDVRTWFLAHGWEVDAAWWRHSYNEERVEGWRWRWRHSAVLEWFEVPGGRDEPPAVSQQMREYAEAKAGLERGLRRDGG